MSLWVCARGYSASRFAAALVRSGCGVGRARDAARDGNGPGGWNGCGALRQDRRFAEGLDAAALVSTLKADGVEMSRGDEIHFNHNAATGASPLADAVRRGKVPTAVVDEMALRRVLVVGANANSPQCRKGCSAEGNVPPCASTDQRCSSIKL